MKDYVLSQPTILASILQPFLDDLKNEIITSKETAVVDAKKATTSVHSTEDNTVNDVHVFTLEEGDGSDLENKIIHRDQLHDHLHDHAHNQVQDHVNDHHHHLDNERDSVENEVFKEMDEIIKKERKLSRKFSGIADILEKKMEAGRLSRNRKSSLLYE